MFLINYFEFFFSSLETHAHMRLRSDLVLILQRVLHETKRISALTRMLGHHQNRFVYP